MSKAINIVVLSACLTILRMGCGFLIIKLVSLYSGPAGLLIISQMQGFTGALNGLVSSTVSSGVVRYTAENHLNSNTFGGCSPWWQASLIWMVSMSIVAFTLVTLNAETLAIWLFNDVCYKKFIIISAVLLPLSGINTLLISIINGLQIYSSYFLWSAASLIIATIFMAAAVVFDGLNGALYVSSSITGVTGLILLIGNIAQPWLKIKYWLTLPKLFYVKKIFHYIIISAAGSVCGSLALVIIREILVTKTGIVNAANWQAVYKVSEVYLTVTSSGLSIYFLPRLSKLNGSDQILREIKHSMIVHIPFMLLGAVIIFLSRDLLLEFLFTSEFHNAKNLFAIQLIGDLVKVLSWFFAFPMIARGASSWFAFTEIAFAFSWIFLSYILISLYGVHGGNYAYLLNYCFYLIFLLFFWKRLVF